MIILYSTHCPKCKVLEQMLQKKNIDYMLEENIEIMLSKGFSEAPILEINNQYLNYKEATNWINNYTKENGN